MLLLWLRLASAAAAQGTPSLTEVMSRVEAYVSAYGPRASVVVCAERYQQEARGSGSAAQTRTLRSDFGLVRADTIHGWLGFRDVIEVDGRRLSDRQDRLAQVLVASQGRFDEARRLSDESARFNVGAIQRNFNVPTTALFFFTPENRRRFAVAARRVAEDGTWEITFRETDRPTLIRTPDGAPIPSSGTIWVAPQGGTVVHTQLQIDTRDGYGAHARRGRGVVDVLYRRSDELNMWLPASMDEQFEVSRDQGFDRVSGHAEYSDCRQFGTSVRIK